MKLFAVLKVLALYRRSFTSRLGYGVQCGGRGGASVTNDKPRPSNPLTITDVRSGGP